MRERVGGARRIVDQRHLAEVRPGSEHGDRLLAHGRDLPADAHLPFEDQVELVADVPLGKEAGVAGVPLLAADRRQPFDVARREAGKERDVAQQLAQRRRWRSGLVAGGRRAHCERNRSASIAAMQPVPAAVTAWR